MTHRLTIWQNKLYLGSTEVFESDFKIAGNDVIVNGVIIDISKKTKTEHKEENKVDFTNVTDHLNNSFTELNEQIDNITSIVKESGNNYLTVLNLSENRIYERLSKIKDTLLNKVDTISLKDVNVSVSVQDISNELAEIKKDILQALASGFSSVLEQVAKKRQWRFVVEKDSGGNITGAIAQQI